MHNINTTVSSVYLGMAPVTAKIKMTSNCMEVRDKSICAICLIDPSDGEETYIHSKTCRLLKCNHRLHFDCIKCWLRYGRYHWPYCRSHVTKS